MDSTPAAEFIEALVHQYYKLVFHTIYGLTNNWEESQDLTQDTFQQALKGIDAARASSGDQFNARAWLLRIALNTVRMQRRRRAIFDFVPFSNMWLKRGIDTIENHDDDSDLVINSQAAPVQPGGYGKTETHDPADLVVEQDAVQRTMAQLPETFRTCLLLSIVGGLSTTEIAKITEMKEPAVRQRLNRARKQFQQIYEQESGEEIIDTTNSMQTDTRQSHTDTMPRQKKECEKSSHFSALTSHNQTLWSSYG